MAVRDRIKELRRVRAGDLVLHERNWRTHPERQSRALRAMLEDVGYADALIARELEDGRLGLIDGELRATLDPDAVVPVLVLDVTEEEADKLLLSLDPIAAMAGADADTLAALLADTALESEDLIDMLEEVAGEKEQERVDRLLEEIDADTLPERPIWVLCTIPVAALPDVKDLIDQLGMVEGVRVEMSG